LAAAVLGRRDTLTSAQPVLPWEIATAAPMNHSFSLTPLTSLVPIARPEVEPKQETDSRERKRRPGFFRSPDPTSRIPVRKAWTGGKEPIRSLHSSFQRMGFAPKKKSGTKASGILTGDEEQGGASDSKSHMGLNGDRSKPTNGSDAWWTSASPSSSDPEHRDSGVDGTAQRIRCEECRLRRIATCTHACPQFDEQLDSQPERRAPIPPSWQDADWEEQRRLKQETDVWIAAQRALNVPEPETEAAQISPNPNVMARGRPRVDWEAKKT
jgi:hypothetical protein